MKQLIKELDVLLSTFPLDTPEELRYLGSLCRKIADEAELEAGKM